MVLERQGWDGLVVCACIEKQMLNWQEKKKVHGFSEEGYWEVVVIEEVASGSLSWTQMIPCDEP